MDRDITIPESPRMKLAIYNRIVLVGFIASLTVLVVACGSSADSSVPEATTGSETTTGAQPIAGAGDAEAGRKLFTSEGCSACHRTSGDRLVGPGLAGISTRSDEAYIRQSLEDPGAVVVDGYPNVMTNFSRLSDEKVDNLIAYLKTLN